MAPGLYSTRGSASTSPSFNTVHSSVKVAPTSFGCLSSTRAGRCRASANSHAMPAKVARRTKWRRLPVQIGIDSFAAAHDDASRAEDPTDRLRNLIEQIEYADQVGLDVFGIGEHHRKDFLDSAPTVILAAAAARTKQIRLTSAVTVLSAIDPVRIFQNFATLDLISGGRAEMVVGRGSFVDAFPLFGLDLQDYDSLFAEHLDLLLQIRDNEFVTWSGQHRP